MKDFQLNGIEVGAACGMDDFFRREPQMITPHGVRTAATAPPKVRRMRVASLQTLEGFQRTSEDTLIHKATNDMWALRQSNGEYWIERLFDGTDQPQKG